MVERTNRPTSWMAIAVTVVGLMLAALWAERLEQADGCGAHRY